MIMNQTRVIIFLKAPIRGFVKTRLAQTLGDDAALGLYRAFVRDILEKIQFLGDVVLYYTPMGHEAALEDLCGRSFMHILQKGNDLGEKMARAFENEFNRGARNIILMGTDVPDVPEDILKMASQALETHPAVIAPSTDGGYFLIGFTARGFSRTVFEKIPWSTPAVFGKTLEIMNQNRLACHVLPSWTDVDTEEDYKALVQRLRSGRTRAPGTLAWIKTHDNVLPGPVTSQ